MATRRPNFRPRSPIPKDKLLEELKNGYTLQEIGDKYNKARSTISETCAMYGIDVEEIQGRKEKMEQRKRKKRQQSFVDVMYDKIKKEL